MRKRQLLDKAGKKVPRSTVWHSAAQNNGIIPQKCVRTGWPQDLRIERLQEHSCYISWLDSVELSLVERKIEAVLSKSRKIKENISIHVGDCVKYLRKTQANVIKSFILYAAPFWAKLTKFRSFVDKISSVYRLTALRVFYAYRIVSDEVAFIIAGMMFIGIYSKVDGVHAY